MKPISQAQERAAFEALYREHHGAVERYVRRRTAPDHVGDVVAETFATAWRRLDDALRGGLPWLYRTAHWSLRNHTRAQVRHHEMLRRLHVVSLLEPAERDATTCGGEELVAAIRTLSVDDREILMLTYWEELTLSETAAVLGCASAATAGVRLHRARKRLARSLSGPERSDDVAKPTPTTEVKR